VCATSPRRTASSDRTLVSTTTRVRACQGTSTQEVQHLARLPTRLRVCQATSLRMLHRLHRPPVPPLSPRRPLHLHRRLRRQPSHLTCRLLPRRLCLRWPPPINQHGSPLQHLPTHPREPPHWLPPTCPVSFRHYRPHHHPRPCQRACQPRWRHPMHRRLLHPMLQQRPRRLCLRWLRPTCQLRLQPH
jgi:hypothetical protein